MANGDRLIVGHKQFVDRVRDLLEATDVHSCAEQDGVSYAAMTKALWNAGYRFDPEARIQWLVVELRSSLDGSLSEMFGELLRLLEVES